MKLLREYIRTLLESATNPKVIFMAGGPGSGKSTVIRKMGLANHLKIINPDDQYETDLKRNGIPLDRAELLAQYRPLKDRFLAAQKAGDEAAMAAVEPEYQRLRSIFSQNMELFSKARNDAALTKERLSEEGGHFLVDGTGGNYVEISTQVEKLNSLGYDVAMIYIDVPIEISLERNRARGQRGGRSLEDEIVIYSWNSVNKNVDKYRQLFGQNFFYIDAEENRFDRSVAVIKPAVLAFLGAI